MASIKGREANTTASTTKAGSRNRRGTKRHEFCTAAAAAAQNEIIQHNLQFGLREQIAYHAIREQALARLSRFLTGLQVFLGTSAIASMSNYLPVGAVPLVSFSALSGVILLVVDPAGGARDHRALRSRYHNILADLEESSCSADDLRLFKARKERIFADSPPAYRGIQAAAYNAAVNSTYPEDEAACHRYHIGFWRSLFANWVPMRGFKFKKDAVG